MARFRVQINTPYSPDDVNKIISEFCAVEGFSFKDYKGEPVFKKGDSLLTAPQYIKVVNNFDGTVLVEAWIKIPILPFWAVGELGLNGFYGAVIKGILRDRVNKLLASISGGFGVSDF